MNIEVIWGHRLLDEGFTSIPNILIRNYRKLGITHGEWGLICCILTYKHDERDPYPSQETLATHMDVDVRQIKKWVQSLVDKSLLLVGQRRNTKSKQFGNAVYNFNPMIQAALKLVGESPLPPSLNDWDIEYREPGEPQVPTDPRELQVPLDSEPQVPTARGPQVPPKRISNKKQIKKNNNIDTAVALCTEIESILGVKLTGSVRSTLSGIPKKLPAWVMAFGEEYILEKARMIRQRHEQKPWDSLIGAFIQSVEEDWTGIYIGNETAAAIEKSTPARDERYAAFYELFPDS